jgi:phosphohistidine phosphatase
VKLYLLRHGEANEARSDNERSLSTAGIENITRLAEFIHPLQLTITHFFHSHKMRAIQTAGIIQPAIKTIEQAVVRTELDPLASIHDLMTESSSWQGDVMLVGHMPYLGKLASFLATGNERLANFAIEPGCLLCFEITGYSYWQLNWMINPKELLKT